MSTARISSRSLVITTADQIVSSASNFLFLILLALTLSVSDFARASTIWIIISFSVVVQRSVFGVPLLLDSNIEGQNRFKISGARLGSVAIGAPALIVALAFFVESGQLIFLYLGLLAPVILLQDLGRYSAISESQGIKALVADLFLLAPVIGAILYSWMSGEVLETSVVALLFTLGLVGALMIVSGKYLIRFSLVELGYMFRTDKARRTQLFFDAALISGTALGSIALTWSFFGAQGVAAFNGSLTALAPIGLATLVVQLVVQHGVVGSVGQVKKRELIISLALIVSSGIWVLLLDLISQTLGRRFLGNSWLPSKELFQAMGFSLIVGLILEVLIVALRAQSEFRKIVEIRKLVIFSIPVAYVGAFLLDRELQFALILNGFWGIIMIAWILATSNPFNFKSEKIYRLQP